MVIVLLLLFNASQLWSEEKPDTIFNGAPVRLSGWLMAKDISPQKSFTELPDSAWTSLNSYPDLTTLTEGNWLLRTDLFIADSGINNTLFGIFPQYFVSAYEIYWDGIKIAVNGTVAVNAEGEKAGIFGFSRALPPAYTGYGIHTIVLRISNHQNYSPWKWYYGSLVVGNYETVLSKFARRGYQAFFISGVLFIAFIFNLFLYLNRRGRIEHFLLSLICFLLISDFLVTQAPFFLELTTNYAHFEYYFYNVLTVLLAILFPAFFIYIFSFSKSIIGVCVLLTLVVYFAITDITNVFQIMALSVLIQSTLLALLAVIKKHKEGIAISVGLLFAWAAYFFDFAFPGLATVIVIGTSFSIARQFAIKEVAEKEALLKSVRLENELLKKNINPHFVLNTLTSVLAWMRRDVSSAMLLIEALAEEFRTINVVSSQKLIPLSEEINLCRAHLRIMSFRKGANYMLETFGTEEGEFIPPMIFHTLVENGLTHGYENKSNGTFMLSWERTNGGIKYLLLNDGDFISEEQKSSSGFGSRYIRSRLEESFAGRWSYISHRIEKGWESVIEIRDM